MNQSHSQIQIAKDAVDAARIFLVIDWLSAINAVVGKHEDVFILIPSLIVRDKHMRRWILAGLIRSEEE